MTPARRISIGLLALVGTFGALDVAQRLGVGTGYVLPEGVRGTPAAPLSLKRDAFKLPVWTEYATVLDRPIFNEDRKPTPVTEAVADKPTGVEVQPLNATLTSVIITPTVKIAIVKDNNTGVSEVVRVGRPLPGEQKGWSLVEVSARGATFEGQGLGRQALELAVNEASAGVQMMPGSAPEAGKPPPPGMSPAVVPTPTPPPPTTEDDAASQARAEDIRKRIEERRRQLREEAERMRSDQTN